MARLFGLLLGLFFLLYIMYIIHVHTKKTWRKPCHMCHMADKIKFGMQIFLQGQTTPDFDRYVESFKVSVFTLTFPDCHGIFPVRDDQIKDWNWFLKQVEISKTMLVIVGDSHDAEKSQSVIVQSRDLPAKWHWTFHVDGSKSIIWCFNSFNPLFFGIKHVAIPTIGIWKFHFQGCRSPCWSPSLMRWRREGVASSTPPRCTLFAMNKNRAVSMGHVPCI